MTRLLRWIFLFHALLIPVGIVSGQVKQVYQQYLFDHQLSNPAYTAFYDNIGFFTLIQNQWAGNHPASWCQMASVHAPVFNNFIGMGLDIVNERSDSIRRFTFFSDFSYELMFSSQLRLRMGATFGFQDFRNTLLDDPGFKGPNLGIGFFLYNHDYYFSLAFPRLLRNNSAAQSAGNYPHTENRQLFLSNGFIFELHDGSILKPVLMYSFPFGSPAQIDMSLNLFLKKKIWLGMIYRTNGSVGLLVQGILTGYYRIGVGGDIRKDSSTGKTTGNFDISVSYDSDFYHRKKRTDFYF